MSQPQDIDAVPLPKSRCQSLQGHGLVSTLAERAHDERSGHRNDSRSKCAPGQICVRLNEELTEPGDLVVAMPARWTGRDCLEADRLPRSIGRLAGLDQVREPRDAGRAMGGGRGLGR
jgi:hypothetical protein